MAYLDTRPYLKAGMATALGMMAFATTFAAWAG